MTTPEKICSPEQPPLIACVLNDEDVWSLDRARLTPADVIELRVDMFARLAADQVAATFSRAREVFGKPLIGTVRCTEEGGQQKIASRSALYWAILPFCDFVDAELRDEEFLAELRDMRAGHPALLIGSHHNFESIPGDDALDRLVAKGDRLGVDLVKIAVTAHAREDALRLLLFTLRHRNRGIITMAMGEAGLPTRVIGPLFGSRITYGYLTTPSAPGQLPVAELDRLLRLFGLR